MIHEYFPNIPIVTKKETAVMIPKALHRQERDWTCAIACLRSIVSSIKNIGTEEEIILKYNLSPGPLYSKNLKELHILDELDVIYGCDIVEKTYAYEYLYDLLKQDYFVMVESMINYDHWLVLCAYFINGEDTPDKQTVLLYDPYYNEMKLYRAEEFGAMWISGNYGVNGVTLDFIAIKYE